MTNASSSQLITVHSTAAGYMSGDLFPLAILIAFAAIIFAAVRFLPDVMPV